VSSLDAFYNQLCHMVGAWRTALCFWIRLPNPYETGYSMTHGGTQAHDDALRCLRSLVLRLLRGLGRPLSALRFDVEAGLSCGCLPRFVYASPGHAAG
jgi:hypothetical protein